jgi:chemosensory pili system protein ChpB (putative protein-glutamate methylesterase)
MDASGKRPQIGVISDSALQRHVLSKALNSFGLNPIVSCGPESLEQQSEKVEQVQCWVLALEDESYESEALDTIIDQADSVPVLFGLEAAPSKHDEQYISWERRLISKLEEHLGSIDILESEDSLLALNTQLDTQTISGNVTSESLEECSSHSKVSVKHSNSASDEIWVLAASLGGPAAVKEFLDEIPASIKAGFLYAQHIDAHNASVLTQVLGRHSMLELKPISDQCIIRDGEVLVVPVDNEITFSHAGVSVQEEEWDGPYGPSIDHLLKNLFAHYGERCHVIVFSGMGNDGSLIAPTMKKKGCTIWAQTPENCANGSMPQSIIDLECSAYTAAPKELAHALINKVGCHENAQHMATNLDINEGV